MSMFDDATIPDDDAADQHFRAYCHNCPKLGATCVREDGWDVTLLCSGGAATVLPGGAAPIISGLAAVHGIAPLPPDCHDQSKGEPLLDDEYCVILIV